MDDDECFNFNTGTVELLMIQLPKINLSICPNNNIGKENNSSVSEEDYLIYFNNYVLV